MTIPVDTISLPGAGEPVAVITIGGRRYQVVVNIDDSGHLVQTVPTYNWWLPPAAVAAGKLYGDFWNPVGSGKVFEFRGIWAIPKSDVAISGAVAVEVGLYRTSAAGSSGTAYTYNGGSVISNHIITPWDTANLAITTSMATARLGPTGGATISALYWGQYVLTEELQAGTYISAYTNLIPVGTVNQRITLREGQGLLIKQGTVAGVGSIAFLALFTMTGTGVS
jgi:hypothetical protein